MSAGALRDAMLAARLDVHEALVVARDREVAAVTPGARSARAGAGAARNVAQGAVIGMSVLVKWSLAVRTFVPVSIASASCVSGDAAVVVGAPAPPPPPPPALRAGSASAASEAGGGAPSTWVTASDLIGSVVTQHLLVNLVALCASLPTAASKAEAEAPWQAALDGSPLLRIDADTFAPRVLAAIVRGCATAQGLSVHLDGSGTGMEDAAARALVWRCGRQLLERAPRLASPAARALLCSTAAWCVPPSSVLLRSLPDDAAVGDLLLVCSTMGRWERGAGHFCRASDLSSRRQWQQFKCRTCAPTAVSPRLPQASEAGAMASSAAAADGVGTLCAACAVVCHAGHDLVALPEGCVCSASGARGESRMFAGPDALVSLKSTIACPDVACRLLRQLLRATDGPQSAARTAVIDALGAIVQWAGCDLEVAGSEGLCGAASYVSMSSRAINLVGGARASSTVCLCSEKCVSRRVPLGSMPRCWVLMVRYCCHQKSCSRT